MNLTFSNLNVIWVAAATFGALLTGTAVRLAALRGVARDVAKQRLDSLKTWWILAIVTIGAALLGRTASVLLLAATSAMAMREFVRLSTRETVDRRLLPLAYALIPLSYFWIWLGWSQVFTAFLPLATLIASSVVLVVAGQTEGFVRNVSRTCLGMLLTVYGLGYAALLYTLPAGSNPVAGASGWFIYLILLTELNDIAQALIGRRIGGRKMTPRVSPNKTWAGFFGGVATTTLLAVGLKEWLTPLSYLEAAAAGLIVALTGFFGDLNMSAIKRDAGVKDSSRLLPGQGGILDRIDSLSLSAPLFYWLVRMLSE